MPDARGLWERRLPCAEYLEKRVLQFFTVDAYKVEGKDPLVVSVN